MWNGLTCSVLCDCIKGQKEEKKGLLSTLYTEWLYINKYMWMMS